MSMMAYRYSDRCLVCSRWQNTFPCKHCECSYYCSIECQVVDLPVHRTLCKSFAQFECDLAPAKRRAIYLPVDGPPQFVWLEMDESAHYDQPDFPAMLKNFLGYSKNYATFSIQQDMVSMAKTYYDQCIMLLYASDQTYTDQPLNKSISTLLGKSAHGVRGPVLAFGQIAHEWEDGQQDLFVTDLDTTDLPIITNWFLGIHREVEVTISCVSAFSHCEQRKSGLRFNCAFMHARFVFCSGLWGTMSQISVIFGMPLMVLIDTQGPNCDRSPEEQKRLEEIVAGLPPDSGNRAVALLLIYMGNHTETADEDFGTIPERCVMRFFFMLLLQSSTTANAETQSDIALSWDLPLSSGRT